MMLKLYVVLLWTYNHINLISVRFLSLILVEYLLSHGINPNISNVDGLTALHQVSVLNNSDIN